MPYFHSSDDPIVYDYEIFEARIHAESNEQELREALTKEVDLERNCAEYGDGNTLVLAAEQDATEAARFLLSVGVKHDVRAFRPAAVHGNFEFVQLLIAVGMQPTHEALVGVKNSAMLRLLLDAGAPINPSPEMYSALRHALWDTDCILVTELLRCGADPNCITDGQTPLMAAVFCEGPANEQIMKVLLDHGADPTIINCDGETALDIARGCEQPSAIQALLRAPSP